MKWELIETKTVRGKETRLYRNSATGSESQTEHIATDKDGGKWFGFKDLRQVPYMRIAYARHVSDLFSIGLSLKDILSWCEEEKKLIKGDDPEKYEKLYALILDKEQIAKHTADPIKQHLALCTIYVLKDEERVDMFSDAMADEKINLWMGDDNMVAFFLSWHNKHIQGFIKTLETVSKIVSKQQDLGIQLPGLGM